MSPQFNTINSLYIQNCTSLKIGTKKSHYIQSTHNKNGYAQYAKYAKCAKYAQTKR